MAQSVNPTLYGSVFENNRNYSVSQTHVTCGPLAVEHSSSLLLSFVLLSNIASFSTKTPNILIHIFCLVSISLSLFLCLSIHHAIPNKQIGLLYVALTSTNNIGRLIGADIRFSLLTQTWSPTSSNYYILFDFDSWSQSGGAIVINLDVALPTNYHRPRCDDVRCEIHWHQLASYNYTYPQASICHERKLKRIK